jgi:hypothetical protein
MKLNAERLAYLLWFEKFGKNNMASEKEKLHISKLLERVNAKINKITCPVS